MGEEGGLWGCEGVGLWGCGLWAAGLSGTGSPRQHRTTRSHRQLQYLLESAGSLSTVPASLQFEIKSMKKALKGILSGARTYITQEGEYDPCYLLFEYVSGFLLRPQQVCPCQRLPLEPFLCFPSPSVVLQNPLSDSPVSCTQCTVGLTAGRGGFTAKLPGDTPLVQWSKAYHCRCLATDSTPSLPH